MHESKGNYGYNAATGEFGDMIEMGILDPTKVTRTALQNAASIAGLMITTECMIAEMPKKEDECVMMALRWYGRHGWYGRNDVITTFLPIKTPLLGGVFVYCAG